MIEIEVRSKSYGVVHQKYHVTNSVFRGNDGNVTRPVSRCNSIGSSSSSTGGNCALRIRAARSVSYVRDDDDSCDFRSSIASFRSIKRCASNISEEDQIQPDNDTHGQFSVPNASSILNSLSDDDDESSEDESHSRKRACHRSLTTFSNACSSTSYFNPDTSKFDDLKQKRNCVSPISVHTSDFDDLNEIGEEGNEIREPQALEWNDSIFRSQIDFS